MLESASRCTCFCEAILVNAQACPGACGPPRRAWRESTRGRRRAHRVMTRSTRTMQYAEHESELETIRVGRRLIKECAICTKQNLSVSELVKNPLVSFGGARPGRHGRLWASWSETARPRTGPCRWPLLLPCPRHPRSALREPCPLKDRDVDETNSASGWRAVTFGECGGSTSGRCSFTAPGWEISWTWKRST